MWQCVLTAMKILLYLLVISSMVTFTKAAVCVCKDGNDEALQKVIDYACASGADCGQIEETGACFQPNTVKNHCDVAVNSYYQKKAPSGATCDFNGAASISTASTSSCLSSSGSTAAPPTGMPVTNASFAFPGPSAFDPSGGDQLSVNIIILTTLAAVALLLGG